jgi:hypothetical protein
MDPLVRAWFQQVARFPARTAANGYDVFIEPFGSTVRKEIQP